MATSFASHVAPPIDKFLDPVLDYDTLSIFGRWNVQSEVWSGIWSRVQSRDFVGKIWSRVQSAVGSGDF